MGLVKIVSQGREDHKRNSSVGSCCSSSSSSSTGSSSRRSISPNDHLLHCFHAATTHQYEFLIGRDDELQQIRDVYEQVSTTKRSQFILISGATGIGKTGLARSILRNHQHPNGSNSNSNNINSSSDGCCHSSGYFVVGKYDQLQRPEPHGALVEICTQFIAQMVDRGHTERFGTTLASYGIDYHHGGYDLIEMIPSLQQIIQPPKLAAVEKDNHRLNHCQNTICDVIPVNVSTTDVVSSHGLSTNRWKDLFRLFFRAVSSMHYSSHNNSNSSSNSNIINSILPVVVLIEDLHWADESSMDVLETLLHDKANHGILFIGTYRTENACATNALALERFIKHQTQNHVTVTHLALNSIPNDAVVHMITHVLSVDTIQAEPLALIFGSWSKGNAFLLWKCFMILHFKNLLHTDPESGQFILDIDEIDVEMHAIKDMMKYKIGLLQESSREKIKVAACLGSKLNEDILAHLFTGKAAAVSTFIDDAATLKLICYDKHRNAWSFSHDYVQEKVYETIPCHERHVYHYRIGRKLWREFAMDELTNFLCLVVGQLLLGVDCIKDQRERVAVAKLCLGAGVRAFQLSNFQSSYTYLKSGIDLLHEDAWKNEYDLIMNLHKTAAEVANSLGIFADVQTLVAESLKHSKSYEDTYRAQATQVQTLGRCGKLEESIQSGLGILTDLGEKIPTNQHPFRSLFELSSLRRRLRGKTNEMIMRLPIMTDPKKISAMEIMNIIFLHAAIVRPELTPLIGCRMVRLSLDYGLSALSCVGFAIFAAAVAG